MIYGYPFDHKSILKGEKLKKKCLRLPPGKCDRSFETSPGMLSNAEDGEFPRFIWQIPTVEKEVDCVLRIRYNISLTITPNENHLRFQSEEKKPFKVFQDRSHVFRILPRPKEISKSERIFNLNVRGKRGNIVQNFPRKGSEYFKIFLSEKFKWAKRDLFSNCANLKIVKPTVWQ